MNMIQLKSLFSGLLTRSFYFLSLLICFSFTSYAQVSEVTISGAVKEQGSSNPLEYVNVVLVTEKDSSFVKGMVSDANGRFAFDAIQPGSYVIQISFIGYQTLKSPVFVGSLASFLDLKDFILSPEVNELSEVTVRGKQDDVDYKLDKKTFTVADNISQSGGSVLQSMQNLPGVTVQDGKVLLRGNDRVMILVDGKQTALTGFNNQAGLDNIPASSIDKIEIINNPSSRYDANGNAGIINIIYKKEKQEGFNGKVGLTGGLGALWEKKQNYEGIRPQYQMTPKINPSLSLNSKRNNINVFFQGDYLYTETLNKNEFTKREYSDGSVINQQLKRNRDTHFLTTKAGMDWELNEKNSLTVSGLYGLEKIIDRGDQPFYNQDLSEKLRLWQFLEDEVLTTVAFSAVLRHRYDQPGKFLDVGFNYSFNREDEKYFFDNTLLGFFSKEAFFLIADQNVFDFNLDYTKPLKHGKLETGFKFRQRSIPTDMRFFASGDSSPLDTQSDGRATYSEIIPAVYGNYVIEKKKFDAEIGMRFEYVDVNYKVDPNHNTYESDGYQYAQPFPNIRLGYNLSENNKLSFSFNRRVDRPSEVDIRIFPKYDDAEIIKVGNPALQPQFTSLLELGSKTSWESGYFYSALYHRSINQTITRIVSQVPESNLIYAIFQNADKSFNSGLEMLWSQDVNSWFSFNLNLIGYYNQIDAFTVENRYPTPSTISIEDQDIFSGNFKWNGVFKFAKNFDAQLSAIYLAPDLIPQGRIDSRFSLDLGLKRMIQKGNGEVFFNATDLLNTMVIKKEIYGTSFNLFSSDYYETQVVRLGYSYKF
jgi:outer membrane receptor protein involved in Fe transport